MTIKLRDRKMLWGRSGGRCALCRIPLLRTTTLGHASVIGEEAHIVAKEVDGPRGTSPLDRQQRDSYSNLILLCPTHHAEIDEIPAGVAEYNIERLLEIKRSHEEMILGASTFDSVSQLEDEQWSFLIDQLGDRLGWDDWTGLTRPIFMGGGPTFFAHDYDRLQETTVWIYSRIWPDSHEDLREVIEGLNHVLLTLLGEFEKHAVYRGEGNLYETEKFYKIDQWDDVLYQRLLRDYKVHTALVQDLAFELTRYSNYIAKLVREKIDSSYRFEEGALIVRPSDFLSWTAHRPEFTDSDFDCGQPFRSLEEFKSDLGNRDVRVRRD